MGGSGLQPGQGPLAGNYGTMGFCEVDPKYLEDNPENAMVQVPELQAYRQGLEFRV